MSTMTYIFTASFPLGVIDAVNTIETVPISSHHFFEVSSTRFGRCFCASLSTRIYQLLALAQVGILTLV